MNAKFLARIPAQDSEGARQLGEDLTAGGPDLVRQLIELVGDQFGDPQGAKPKYALHGLIHYVSRPGADDQRKMVAQTLAGALADDHSDDLKAFIIRQLQFCGQSEEVPSIAKLLSNDRLYNPAVQALAAIGGPSALRFLRDALQQADASRRVAFTQAIDFISGR